MAFTASVMPRLLTGIETIHAAPNLVNARYAQEPIAVQSLLQNQTARSVERLTNGSCVGVDIWFFDPGAGGNGYEGEVVDPALTCATPTCDVGQTAGQAYDNNIFWHKCKQAQEDRCNNELEFADESSRVIWDLMYDARLFLQKKAINKLVAVAQQNQAPLLSMPSYITERAASNILEIDPTNMSGDLVFSTLLDINTIALQNSIANPIFLSGKNFYNSQALALYNRLNDNERSQNAMFNAYMNNIVNDFHISHGVDVLTGELSTLAVTPNAYAFWNYTLFPDVPRLRDSARNLWEFRLADPILKYNDGGVIKPVMYDMKHWYECAGVDAAGKDIYTHKYELFIRGGFTTAPMGFSRGGTQVYSGVMHYVAV